ncbi:MAG: transporter substrate-binding domain-containing protein [Lachnospiraceae bacterium]|nr:ABC transporter substrate-binding protein [Cuneatibacter sp.]MDD6455115.1 transporter substrate-binding domain-containing protein [Lachnospiraceae bacterium]
MKRFSLKFLCILLTLGLCACSTVGQKEEDLPQLVIGGSTYEPYFYRDINGDYAGIDVELATEVCRRIGVKPVFREIPLEERLQSLSQGKVDCVWSALSMSGQEDRYLWAGPYLYAQRVIVVPRDSEIRTLQDLEGKRVAVQTGSISESIILNHSNPDLPEFGQLTVLDESGEVFTALRKGYVDAIAGLEGGLSVYVQEYPDQYRMLSISSEPLGVAFQPDGDAELASQLEQVFQEMREDGTIEEIVTAYGLDVEKNLYGGLNDAIAKSE